MSDPVGKEPRCMDNDFNLIDWFCNPMLDKMRVNAHKAHWNTVTQQWLMERLHEEVYELVETLANGGDVISEAADVANFAAMIADNHRNESNTLKEGDCSKCES